MPQKFLLWTVALLGFYSHALGQDGPYIRMGLGIAIAPAMDVRGTDNDWGTKCDRIINPDGLEVTDECDSVPAPTEWENAFGGGSGIGSGLALGYRWGAFRIEGEYFHRSTTYDERSDIAIFDAITLDKQDQEIELAIAGVDNLLAHNLFANAYYDFALGPALVSYAGAGAGMASTSLYYFTNWKRNDDPSRIRTFADPDLNAKIAGSTTIGQARLTDRRIGYQLLAGGGLSDRRPRRSGPQATLDGFRRVRKRKNRVGSTAQPRLHSGARRANSIHYHHGRHPVLGRKPQPAIPVLRIALAREEL